MLYRDQLIWLDTHRHGTVSEFEISEAEDTSVSYSKHFRAGATFASHWFTRGARRQSEYAPYVDSRSGTLSPT